MSYSKKVETLVKNEIDISLKERQKKVITELELQERDCLLDAGCGPGNYIDLIIKLKIKNIQITGADLDIEALNQIRQKHKSNRVKVISADLSQLPFPDNFFNKIIFSEVMEHLENDLEVLKELHRVLSYHGVIVVTTPNKNFPFFWDPVNKILEIFFNKHIQKGFWAGIWTNHLRLYYPSEAEKILEEAGFEIINRESLTRLCLPFNKNLLYGGKLPRNISESFLNNIKKNKKPLIIILMLYIVNLIDKMNSNFTWKNIGVNVFIKAKKV